MKIRVPTLMNVVSEREIVNFFWKNSMTEHGLKFTSFCEKHWIPRRNWRNAAWWLSIALCHVPLGQKSLVHFQICKSLRTLCVSAQRNFERKACNWNMLPCSDVIISRKHSINIEFPMILNKHFQLNSFVKTDRLLCNIHWFLQWKYYFIINLKLEIALVKWIPKVYVRLQISNDNLKHFAFVT